MKTLLIIVLLGCLPFKGQAAPFQNLDFEMVNTNRVTWRDYITGYGPSEDLVPGWKISYTFGTGATQAITQVGYNNSLYNPMLGAGFISIFAREYTQGLQQTLRGGHILYWAFYDFIDGTLTLSQRGDIPEGASRIFLEKDAGSSRIYLNGAFVGNFVGDIAAFAGQKDVELTITFYYRHESDFRVTLDRVMFIISEPDQPWLQVYYIGGKPQLRVIGTPSVDYVIETSSNDVRNWTLFQNLKSDGYNSVILPIDGVPNRFFRARKAP